MTRILAYTCALLAAAAAISPGCAQPLKPLQMKVYYGDLDLSHADGAQALLGRLKMASTHVCGGQPTIGDLTSSRYYQSCFRQAMDGAIASIGTPLVAQLYGKPELVAESRPAGTQTVAQND